MPADPGPATRYPSLFAPATWGPLHVRFELSDRLPPDLAIANVNIVPCVDDRVVAVRLSNGRIEMPGGTLEPGEDFLQAARRELMEEAGAQLSTLSSIGYWKCFSSAPEPFRSHIPHPSFARLVGIANVSLIGSPSNPEGGEKVAAVEVLSLADAAARFAENGRNDIAELYCLASELRNNGV